MKCCIMSISSGSSLFVKVPVIQRVTPLAPLGKSERIWGGAVAQW